MYIIYMYIYYMYIYNFSYIHSEIRFFDFIKKIGLGNIRAHQLVLTVHTF